MPVRGSHLLEFCIMSLDGREFINFSWIDRTQGRFVLVCMNKKNKRWTQDYIKIFVEYAKSCPRESSESSDKRQRFISALDKSEFLEKIRGTDKKRREYKIKDRYFDEYLTRARLNSDLEACLQDISADFEMGDESFFESGSELSPFSEGSSYSPLSSVGSPPDLSAVAESTGVLSSSEDELVSGHSMCDFQDLSKFSEVGIVKSATERNVNLEMCSKSLEDMMQDYHVDATDTFDGNQFTEESAPMEQNKDNAVFEQVQEQPVVPAAKQQVCLTTQSLEKIINLVAGNVNASGGARAPICVYVINISQPPPPATIQ